MQSLKSNALEPTRRELAELSGFARLLRLLPVFGLPILTLLLIALFSILLPDTFPTLLNLRSIIGDKAIIAILALAAMIPMSSGRIDLTVGYGIVLWHILAISLQTVYGLDWITAVLIVLVLGALLGLLNGLLVEIAQIDSFIATLGTGTVLYAVAMWHTQGRQVIGSLPDAFTALFTSHLWGMPIVAVYVLVISLVLWLAADFLPVGRYLYAIGANSRAATLNGIPTRRYVIGAFVASGALTAFAGVILAAKLRIFFTTMADVTASAYDTIKSFAQDANVPPYFTGSMSLDRGTSKLFYRTGDKTEYVVLSGWNSHLIQITSVQYLP